jgi:hypothetical protein
MLKIIETKFILIGCDEQTEHNYGTSSEDPSLGIKGSKRPGKSLVGNTFGGVRNLRENIPYNRFQGRENVLDRLPCAFTSSSSFFKSSSSENFKSLAL